ncbi:MAG TPA: trypsin-like peptidase domain-containing protein [Candidatus Tumulicola sp.]|nr:trypsin-like peptidase domain-containing protein [Candidatus Tumulicola sp.]
MVNKRFLPTLIVGLVGAVVGSFLMMLYASSHFGGTTGPDRTPPAVAAVPLSGVSDQDRIVSAVKRTKSSVVAIVEDINGQQYVPTDPFFQQFFGQGPGQVQTYRGQASGSGFVIDGQGDIVTNAHVVQPQSGARVTKMTAVFANGDHVPAHVVAANVGADCAIIKVDDYRKLPPPLQLADSNKLEQGQWAIAIGEPLELQQTVTVGVVSGFNRSEPIPTESGGVIDFKGLLQTSAPINPGNSGGPLIDIDGQVIGINQSTVKSAYAQGIGFAIPANTVKTVVADLLKHPGIHQGTDTGFLGIYMQDLSDGIRNQIGYNGQSGIAVQQVISGSPADQAGIQPGDVILQVDGKNMDNRKSLHDYVASKKPGDTIRVDVWSQGVKKLVSVKLGETPAAQPMAQQQQGMPQEQPEQPQQP